MKKKFCIGRLASRRTTCMFLLCMALAPLAGVAATQEEPALKPEADEWLRRMSDYLSHAKFFTIKAEIWQDIQSASGQQLQAGRTLQFQVRRPNRLHVVVHSPRRNRELFYDGSHITLLNRLQNFYGAVKAAGNLDEAMDTAVEKFGIAMPLEDFLLSNPYKDLVAKTIVGRDVGSVDVLGVPCEHLLFVQDNLDWQVWIERGPRPVPKKFVITYKDEPGAPEFIAIFTGWDFMTELPDFVFKFEPPPGANPIKVQEMKASLQPGRKEGK